MSSNGGKEKLHGFIKEAPHVIVGDVKEVVLFRELEPSLSGYVYRLLIVSENGQKFAMTLLSENSALIESVPIEVMT